MVRANCVSALGQAVRIGDTMPTAQRTQTDFMCLTIKAGNGTPNEAPWRDGEQRYAYIVRVKSDATQAVIMFRYFDSIDRYSKGIDQLDRENLLYAFRAFVMDAEAGQQSYKDFCDDFGYDADEPGHRRTWQACRSARAKFGRLWHDAREPGQVLEMLALEGIE